MSSSLDTRIRDAEARLYLGYGLSAIEHDVRLPGSGAHVRVVDFHGDAPGIPVVMLHGIASVTAVAAPLIAELSRERRVVAIDWPGHGLSDALELHTSVREHAVSVLTGILDQLGIEVADVVAHSLGGQFALYLALAAPARVHRLVLLGAPGAGFEGVAPATAMKVMATPVLGRLVLSMPTSVAAYRRNSGALLGPHALDGHPDAMVTVGHLASKRPGFARSLSTLFSAILSRGRVRDHIAVTPRELGELTPPVLLVWGDHDVFMRPADAAASVDAISNATLVTVANAGHAPWLDDESTVVAAIEPFLTAR